MRRRISFWKIEAAGNDFVLVDNRNKLFSGRLPELTQFLCRRRFGIGADGAIFIHGLEGYDFEMNYYNADGSGSMMCGNGGRAALLFVHDYGIRTQENYKFRAADGYHFGRVRENKVMLTIKLPEGFEKVSLGDTEGFLVNTGAPHLVIFQEDINNLNIHSSAPELRKEYNSNVNFVEKVSEDSWKIRTFERGVEDETLACGTGVVASSFIISKIFGKKLPLAIQAKGGKLYVESIDGRVWLSGPTRKVFEGTVLWEK